MLQIYLAPRMMSETPNDLCIFENLKRSWNPENEGKGELPIIKNYEFLKILKIMNSESSKFRMLLEKSWKFRNLSVLCSSFNYYRIVV